MRVLVACEYSGIVRDAFARLGFEAWSCDLLPTEAPGNHYQADAIEVAYREYWDLMVAHPPCTRIAVCGAKHFRKHRAEQEAGLQFVAKLMNAPIRHIAIENPIGVISSRIRKPDQIIQPWQFGHGECKATCFWLKRLPRLIPTNIVAGREQRIFKMAPSADRGKKRSLTYSGIADAMAQQWGTYVRNYRGQ